MFVDKQLCSYQSYVGTRLFNGKTLPSLAPVLTFQTRVSGPKYLGFWPTVEMGLLRPIKRCRQAEAADCGKSYSERELSDEVQIVITTPEHHNGQWRQLQ